MKCLYRVFAAGAVVAIGLCNIARAESVLEQVPSQAVGVFEVKDLQAVSTKVAKFAKTLGVDQFDPRFADPLAALEDEYELKQGLNKDGDMAIAFFAPPEGEDMAKDGDKQVIVLVATSDFKAFLGNFQDVKDDGAGVFEVTVPKNKEKLFLAEHGGYAAAAKDKALLAAPVGLKLEGAALKEAQSKDAVMYINMKALRPKLEKGLKDARTELEKVLKDPKAKGNGVNIAMTPQLGKMLEMYLNAGDQVVRDGKDAAFSFNLSDTGISSSTVADFEPDSETGRLVAQVKNTDQPLSVGLPAATYFAFGGAIMTPELTTKLFTDFIEPFVKDAGAQGNGADLAKAVESMKDAMGATKSIAFGYVAGSGVAGEGLINAVSVAHGDAKKILDAQKDALPAINSFMGMSGQKTTAKVDLGETKTVDGVTCQPFTMKFNFDPNDAQAAQAQQMISLMYGRNGLSGELAAVNDSTFISVLSSNDKLLSDAIAAAKTDSDDLDKLAHVKKVAGELPNQRSMEGFIALDNIARMAVKVMKQQGLAIPFKLPPDLPPIGVSAGTDGSTARVDVLIPTQLIQSMVAAGMQAFMQMNGGPGNGQGGGI